MINKLILSKQKKIYSKKWNEYSWNGEKLYAVLLSLEEILSGSTARLHTSTKINKYNVLGTPRSGTVWMIKILSLLTNGANKGFLKKILPIKKMK